MNTTVEGERDLFTVTDALRQKKATNVGATARKIENKPLKMHKEYARVYARKNTPSFVRPKELKKPENFK